MVKVYLICEKLCSGKTYYFKKLRDEMNVVILSPYEATYDLINNEQEEFYNIFCDRLIQFMNKKCIEIIKAGANVIYERGLWSKEERIKTKQFFKDNGIDYELRYIHVTDENWNRQIEKKK